MLVEIKFLEEEPDQVQVQVGSAGEPKGTQLQDTYVALPGAVVTAGYFYALGELQHFVGNVGPKHLNILCHLLGYLTYKILFLLTYKWGKQGVDPLSGFTDANWKVLCPTIRLWRSSTSHQSEKTTHCASNGPTT